MKITVILSPAARAKAGIPRDGLLRQRMRTWGVFEDVVAMAILRDDREILEVVA